jgi:hypothetical protein
MASNQQHINDQRNNAYPALAAAGTLVVTATLLRFLYKWYEERDMKRYIAPNDLLKKLENIELEERLEGLSWVARHKYKNFTGDVLQLLQEDTDPEVRAKSAWVLDILQSQSTIPALIDALWDTDFSVRSSAGWALVHQGEAAVAGVIEVLRHGDKEAREIAYQVLRRIPCDEAREAIYRYWE